MSRVSNLSISELEALVQPESECAETDRQEVRDWLEIRQNNYELEGTIIYQPISHYFKTESGIHFNISSELFYLCEIQVGQRLRVKVDKNYSGKWGSGIPTTYGGVVAILKVLDRESDESEIMAHFHLGQQVRITDPDCLKGQSKLRTQPLKIVSFTTSDPPQLIVQWNDRKELRYRLRHDQVSAIAGIE